MENFENENNTFGEGFADGGNTPDNTPYNTADTPAQDRSETEASDPMIGATPADAYTSYQEPAVPDSFSQDPAVPMDAQEADPCCQAPDSAAFYGAPAAPGVPYEQPRERIEFSAEIKDYSKKSASKGLRVFAAVLAVILIITLSCAVSYNIGRMSSDSGSRYSKTDMKVYPKPADSAEMTPQQIYDKVKDSVVGIIAYNSDGDASQATGVVYTDNGYILTNDHIYTNIPAAKFKIYASNGEVFDAEYVAGDTVSDLALLKVKNAKGLKKPEFGDSTAAAFGENVVAIGRPGNARGQSAITTGVVSNPAIRAQVTSSYSVSMIQTDCDIYEGSSGGALVNMYGQVIGITSSKAVSDTGESMCYAIPVKTVARVAPQLSSKGKVVDRARLGITYREVTSLEAELNGVGYSGLYINEVSEDSDLAGKASQGCMITHINGEPVTSAEVVLDIIDDSRANDTIRLTVVDTDGNAREYTVKLKANVGESSYTTEKMTIDDKKDGQQEGGAFNFPKGE